MKIKSLAIVSAIAITSTATSQAALSLTFDEVGGNTIVTLEGVNFTTAGLTETTQSGGGSTYITPLTGTVIFTGSTDSSAATERYYTIPTFTFGSGSIDSAASNLSASNPFINIVGNVGRLNVDDQNSLPANFTGTATYSGTLADNGIDDTFQSFTFANGQVFTIGTAVPEPSSTALLGLGGLALILRRRK